MNFSSIEGGRDGDFLKKDSFVVREGLKQKWEQSLYTSERQLQNAAGDCQGSGIHFSSEYPETIPAKTDSGGAGFVMEAHDASACGDERSTSNVGAAVGRLVDDETDIEPKRNQAKTDSVSCCAPVSEAKQTSPLHLHAQDDVSQNPGNNSQEALIDRLAKPQREAVIVSLTGQAEGVSVWIRMTNEARGQKIIGDVLGALRLNDWAKGAQVFVNGSLYARYK